MNEALKLTPFTPFQSNLESLHNHVHNAVGGDMDTARSPNDPLFFLHHANIDRLWAQWQASPQAGRSAERSRQPQADRANHHWHGE